MNRSILRSVGTVAFVGSMLAVVPVTSFAEERTCRGTIGAEVRSLRVRRLG